MATKKKPAVPPKVPPVAPKGPAPAFPFKPKKKGKC